MHEAQVFIKRFSYVLATLIVLLLASQLILRLQHSRLEKGFASDLGQHLDQAGVKIKGAKTRFGNLTGKEGVCQVAAAFVIEAKGIDLAALERAVRQGAPYPYDSGRSGMTAYRIGAEVVERRSDMAWQPLGGERKATGDALYDTFFAPYADRLTAQDYFLVFFDETAAHWDTFDMACRPGPGD